MQQCEDRASDAVSESSSDTCENARADRKRSAFSSSTTPPPLISASRRQESKADDMS